MKLSLATRIFLGYAVVLVTFGAVSLFSVAELHRNRLEIRLVSQGYLQLSQDAAALETLPHQPGQGHRSARWSEDNVETRRALIPLARLYFPSLTQRLATDAGQGARHPHLSHPRASSPSSGSWRRASESWRRSMRPRAHGGGRLHGAGVRHAGPGEDGRLDGRAAPGGDQHRPRAAGAAYHPGQPHPRARGSRRGARAAHGAGHHRALAAGDGRGPGSHRLLSARTLRPVRTLIEGVSRIGRGDYSAQLGVQGDDEMAVLAREFDAMARSLQAREAQLKAQAEALARAEQLAAVGRISAQIAHEVRNPLSSIGLNVEMLRRRAGPRHVQRQGGRARGQGAARRGDARGGSAHRRHRAVPAHGAPAQARRWCPRT